MIEPIEKNMVSRRVFHRVLEDPPEGFPFELRMAWRASMRGVYGNGVLELARFDGERGRLDESLCVRFGPASFLFVPQLIQGTREAVECVLLKQGLIRPRETLAFAAPSLSVKLRKEAAQFDWEDKGAPQQARATYLIQRGADAAFKEAWFQSWAPYLRKSAASAARRSYHALRYEEVEAAFVEVFWELTQNYKAGDTYSFKARLRFALMRRVDDMYRALPAVTVSEPAHRHARREELQGGPQAGFKTAVLLEKGKAPSSGEVFEGNAFEALAQKGLSRAVQAALARLTSRDSQLLTRYLGNLQKEVPPDLLPVLAALRAELADWRS